MGPHDGDETGVPGLHDRCLQWVFGERLMYVSCSTQRDSTREFSVSVRTVASTCLGKRPSILTPRSHCLDSCRVLVLEWSPEWCRGPSSGLHSCGRGRALEVRGTYVWLFRISAVCGEWKEPTKVKKKTGRS